MAFPSLEPGMSRPSSGIASPPARSRSRTQSISSDRPSTIGQHSLMSPPLSVSPEAAFIARSAASQIVTNDHDSHADTWYDQHGIEPSGESASVSDAALRLVNSFLDQLLFNFLSLAGSTTLPALRPAVSQVLKPKLAKDAINQAEEELREYLGGGDDDELLQGPGAGPKDWDLELVWKRTRLRCMVYSSLGDLEEEDEDYHMEEENLEMGDETLGETVSPAVAIFLTSILEFMGEQALIVAGQAAYHRMRARYEKEMKEGSKTPADAADRITVEDVDMERVALDRTLGRLWRAWKKRIRSPGLGTMEHFPRPRSRDSSHASQLNHLRQLSLDPESSIPQAVTEKPDEHEQENLERTPQKEGPVPPLEEYLVAAAIPLPAGENDVAEIEVPGLATYSDDESEDNEVEDDTQPIRPKSLMIFPPANTTDLPTPTMSQPNTPVFATRKRSNSLPTPATSPYRSVLVRETVAPTIGASPESITDVERDASREISTKELSKERRASEQTPVLDETSDTESNTEESNQLASKRLSTVIGDIAVVGPTTTLDSADEADANDQNEEDDTIEFTEEPQILTSSRISISGRSSSPASSDHGRESFANE
ncbi:FLO11-like protein [Pleurostoma richardsiae]|uniref:FLO11-like protein n=1 Tax=Pleurostoma richardsiae TaxID=41990 RepID=A0AA38VZV8_9PEZI|nr:FLO11-like protein [Pleurostoma richardsiae]